jgi:hypothetical protein
MACRYRGLHATVQRAEGLDLHFRSRRTDHAVRTLLGVVGGERLVQICLGQADAFLPSECLVEAAIEPLVGSRMIEKRSLAVSRGRLLEGTFRPGAVTRSS